MKYAFGLSNPDCSSGARASKLKLALMKPGAGMPRYYFDIRDGDYVQKDDEGTILPSVREAKAQAVKTLPDIARDELPDADRREFVIEVKDENGRPVLTARLSILVEVFG